MFLLNPKTGEKRPSATRLDTGEVSVTAGPASGFQYRINGGSWVAVEGETLPYTITAIPSDTVEVRGLGGVVDAGDTPPVYGITGLIAELEARFYDTTNWETPGTGLTYNNTTGRLEADGTQSFSILNYELDAPISTGSVYAAVMSVPVLDADSVRPRLEGGGANVSASVPITYASTTVRRFVAGNDHTDLAVVVTADFEGEVGYANLFPLDDRIAAPADIFIFAGQSNMVGGSATEDWDPAVDLPNLDVLAVAGFGRGADGYTNDQTGPSINALLDTSYGIGHPVPMVHPITHSSPNLGRVSPAGNIMRTIYDAGVVSGEREAVAACMAAADTDLFEQWNPGDDGHLYDLMVANVDAILARNDSTEVKALFWCQGESSEPEGYAALFKSIIDTLRASWGDFPVIIMEQGFQVDNPGGEAMKSEQQKLATGSGDPSELTNCIYVERPDGATFIDGDDVHYDGATNRVRGTEAGQAYLANFA